MKITLQGGPHDGAEIDIDDTPAPVTITTSTRIAGSTYTLDRNLGIATYQLEDDDEGSDASP